MPGHSLVHLPLVHKRSQSKASKVSEIGAHRRCSALATSIVCASAHESIWLEQERQSSISREAKRRRWPPSRFVLFSFHLFLSLSCALTSSCELGRVSHPYLGTARPTSARGPVIESSVAFSKSLQKQSKHYQAVSGAHAWVNSIFNGIASVTSLDRAALKTIKFCKKKNLKREGKVCEIMREKSVNIWNSKCYQIAKIGKRCNARGIFLVWLSVTVRSENFLGRFDSTPTTLLNRKFAV